jgi:hypothetical protein
VLEKSFRVATADPGAVRDNNLSEANPITECRSSLMVSAVARSYVTYYATALGALLLQGAQGFQRAAPPSWAAHFHWC